MVDRQRSEIVRTFGLKFGPSNVRQHNDQCTSAKTELHVLCFASFRDLHAPNLVHEPASLPCAVRRGKRPQNYCCSRVLSHGLDSPRIDSSRKSETAVLFEFLQSDSVVYHGVQRLPRVTLSVDDPGGDDENEKCGHDRHYPLNRWIPAGVPVDLLVYSV